MQPLYPLTPRQMQIARLLAVEKTNKEIGKELGIAEATVEKHRTDLKMRLGVKTLAGITRYVIGLEKC